MNRKISSSSSSSSSLSITVKNTQKKFTRYRVIPLVFVYIYFYPPRKKKISRMCVCVVFFYRLFFFIPVYLCIYELHFLRVLLLLLGVVTSVSCTVPNKPNETKEKFFYKNQSFLIVILWLLSLYASLFFYYLSVFFSISTGS